MRVLVACEFSGAVRDAFAALGHDAWSCDLLPSETPGQHIVGDVLPLLADGWDLMVAHPPCTFLASSANRWLYDERYPTRRADRDAAVAFVRRLFEAPIRRIAIENPRGHLSTAWRPPSQVVHPHWFGDPHSKATCLWLKGLPPLMATRLVNEGKRHVTKSGRSLPDWYNLPPSANRSKIRSRTFAGTALAMAAQWGGRVACAST
jgi:hypothetical protein